MDKYRIWLRLTIEYPWTEMQPLYLGFIPKTLPTPSYFCTIERNGESYLVLYIYEYLKDVKQWHQWLIVGCYDVYFVMLGEKQPEIVVKDIGYFCDMLLADEYALIASSSHVYRFDRNTQLCWKTEVVTRDNLFNDGIVIDDVQGECIYGTIEYSFEPFWSTEQPWPTKFKLSLSTGKLIE